MADIDLEALPPFAAERAAVRLHRAAARTIDSEAGGVGSAGTFGRGPLKQVSEPTQLAVEVPDYEQEHAFRAHGLPQKLYQAAKHGASLLHGTKPDRS